MRMALHVLVGCALCWIAATGSLRGDEAASDEPAKIDNVAVASALRNLGALVRADSDGTIREISFAFSKEEADVTPHLKGLKDVEVLDLSGCNVVDDSLKNLATLKNIELLVLARTKVTDAGLEHLTVMTKLAGLDLSGTGVTGPGLSHLKNFKELSDLLLDRTALTDEHLGAIAELSQLNSVSLIGAKQLTAQGITRLKRSAPKLIVVR